MSALADRFTHDILKLIDSGALEGSFADFVRLSGKKSGITDAAISRVA